MIIRPETVLNRCILAIAIPLGLSSTTLKRKAATNKKNLELLLDAETRFLDALQHAQSLKHVFNTRNAATSLVLVESFQIASGSGTVDDARLAVEILGKQISLSITQLAHKLLDASAALTLKNELLEIIDLKFSDLQTDDMSWYSFIDRPSPQQPKHSKQWVPTWGIEQIEDPETSLKHYWKSVEARYSRRFGLEELPVTPMVDSLPRNWTVINITLSEDKTVLFISRQRPSEEPLLFCVPFDRHGRKEGGEEPFIFNQAMQEFSEILRDSDVSAKTAKDIGDERSERVAWWSKRTGLDKRMKEFLENLEFCWLGAFKVYYILLS